jgi:hypothetical protein
MALTRMHVSPAVSYSGEKCFVGTPKVVTRADSDVVDGMSNDTNTLNKPNIRKQPLVRPQRKGSRITSVLLLELGAVNVQGDDIPLSCYKLPLGGNPNISEEMKDGSTR